MRLSTMLGIGFAVVIIIGFFVALFASAQLVAVAHNMNYCVDVRLVNLQLINDIKDNNTKNAYDIRSLALFTTQSHSDKEYQENIQEKEAILEKSVIENNQLLQQLDNVTFKL